MTLTYIFHSGFVLETEASILIFDYWMDPANVMSSVLSKNKQMYVFSSHFHEDHFTKEIFEWKKQRSNITYILSKDIYKHRRASKEDADAWLAKGGTWTNGTISVWATGSNDSGVSWIIETDGKRIFHAGDLNNWYSKFLPDAVPGETIHSVEMDEDIDPIAFEKRYLGELKDIKKITDSFDVAMFPVDGRVGNGYTLGGRQFIERFKVGLFVPMHFVASGFEPMEQREQSRTCSSYAESRERKSGAQPMEQREQSRTCSSYAESRERKSGAQSAWRFKEFADELNVPFWEISKEGESIEI